MNFERLLSHDVQAYIQLHEKKDVSLILLKQKEIMGIPAKEIADQIEGRRKARLRLPFLYNCKNIIYPPSLNLEQSSSEATARYKALLMDGKRLADLTGGLGIDSYFFSKSFEEIDYVEPEEKLFNIAKHNHIQLKTSNINHYHSSASDFLETHKKGYDLIYLDPSRRNQAGRKVSLDDYSPNVLGLIEQISRQTRSWMIKVSPMLDVKKGLEDLKKVKSVHIISLNNECKEILYVGNAEGQVNPMIRCVNLTTPQDEIFEFNFQSESETNVTHSEALHFLYEPNSSILKAGAFKTIANAFGLYKIHPNTHLYTSADLIASFPGRIFHVKEVVKPHAKFVHEKLPEKKANIITRNYPLASEALRKKLKLKDGGEAYLIGFRDQKKTRLVIASRIK